MNVTALDIARRFVGQREVAGALDNPMIMAMLTLDNEWPEHDEVPWCSGFVNYIAWLLALPRSKSLRARSWLAVGEPIELERAQPGFDVIILSRGSLPQPPPADLTAPGHVGFYAGESDNGIRILGGNQRDSVSIGNYPYRRLLGVRRLWQEEH